MKKNKIISFKKYTYLSSGVLLLFIIWSSFFAMMLETKMYMKNWYIVILYFVFFSTFSIFISHYNLYYLIITPKEIIIKNLAFFWIKKVYQIENIISISKTLKKTGKGGWYGIVIHLKKPIEGYTYYMSSIKPKFWKRLKMELNKVNIEFEINKNL